MFNGIELIQVACSSLPCTLSIYNAFMWTFSVKAGQSELDEARVINEHTKERTHHETFLNLYIDSCRSVASACFHSLNNRLLTRAANGCHVRLIVP